MNRLSWSLLFETLFLISSIVAQETYNLEIIWQKTGDTTFLSYGLLPTTSGDVNGDGYYDILYYGNERSWAGRAYLFYGGNNIDTIPDAVFSNSNGYDAICMGNFNGDRFDDVAIGNILDFNGYGGISIYLGSNPVDTILDYKFRGPQVGSNFGCAVASGDVNGDSFGDLIVGAYGAAPRP
ncbi:MAG: VCBS repeat-containing protein, partial [candidate division WOR-3 bacterium]|nr:VCBS repeat-containing protein [candidate division WOR-3 bacterium]